MLFQLLPIVGVVRNGGKEEKCNTRARVGGERAVST